MSTVATSSSGPRAAVREVVDAKWFHIAIVVLILLNAVIIGLETYPAVVAVVGPALEVVNMALILVFGAEVLLRIYAHGSSFFKDGWNVFDLVVVAAAFIPPNTGAVLRILRLLRVLRLLSAVRSMRMVLGALGAAVPGMISIGTLLGMIIYVFAIASTTILGQISPTFFGNLWVSIASMFRIAIGDGWEDVITPIALEHPWVWAYFMVYGVISSLIILNLFIAVAVEGMDRMKALGLAKGLEEDIELDTTMLEQIRQLRLQLQRVEAKLEKQKTAA